VLLAIAVSAFHIPTICVSISNVRVALLILVVTVVAVREFLLGVPLPELGFSVGETAILLKTTAAFGEIVAKSSFVNVRSGFQFVFVMGETAIVGHWAFTPDIIFTHFSLLEIWPRSELGLGVRELAFVSLWALLPLNCVWANFGFEQKWFLLEFGVTVHNALATLATLTALATLVTLVTLTAFATLAPLAALATETHWSRPLRSHLLALSLDLWVELLLTLTV
jgi:hypothetical protein